jgi:preprotein translocase subunit SecE
LSLAVVLLAGAVVAFYWFADQSLLMRVLGLLGVAAVSVLIALQTNVGRSAWLFIGTTRTEVRKVVWPTRAETTQTALAVLFVVVLMGVVLWLLDMFLLWAIRLLTGQGG